MRVHNVMKTPILQFGTSRFLQAHADLFLSEAAELGQAVGPITVVQSSGDAARAARLNALAGGYVVRVEGVVDGTASSREIAVTSVARCLSSTTDWGEVTRVACEEAEIILSNTGDVGFEPKPSDGGLAFDQSMSYPGKLLCLLHARFLDGARPLQVMPLELVPRNGDVLRARILELAAPHGATFIDYLEGQVIWANSLVDRIVSAPIEPAGAVAEPYALWAIEAQPGLVAPCDHPAVRVVPDLGQIEALKLFILNLGHSYMAHNWLAQGADETVFVRHIMDDPVAAQKLADMYRDEVLPAFAAGGLAADAQAYVEISMARFANPYLDHKLADIAQNHHAKVSHRIAAFLEWARVRGDTGSKPILAAVVAAAKSQVPA